MNWMEQEKEKLLQAKKNNDQYVRFDQNTVVEFDVDASKPFEEVVDQWGKVKARIPCLVKGFGKVKFWDVSKNNPIYFELIEGILHNQIHFKVIRTGTGEQTKYAVVK